MLLPDDIWKLLAGLAIFLYGMYLMEDAIRAISGRSFRRMIRQSTDGRLRSIAGGTLVTAILQSSSAVSLMVLAFVGAGVMSMENGIGVIMGANLGTTVTSWIVALFGFKVRVESFAQPLIVVGGFFFVAFAKTSRLHQAGRLLIGFGLLFLGLDFMKTGVEQYAAHVDLARFAGYGLWAYLLLSVGMTALMQSSSAAIAIILTGLNSGLIGFQAGMAMVIGANIGTTVTVLLGSLGAIPAKKRVSASHLIFNIGTGVLAFAFLKPLAAAVQWMAGSQGDTVIALALFHSLFNILGVMLFFPFIGVLARLLDRFYPERREILTVYLVNTPVEVTEAAISALRSEILHLFQECRLYILRIFGVDDHLVFDRPLPFEEKSGRRIPPADIYGKVKVLHGEILEFYARLVRAELKKEEAQELERIIYASRNIMNSIKNIKGLRHDLEGLDASVNEHVHGLHRLLRRRLLYVYHDLDRFLEADEGGEGGRILMQTMRYVEDTDARFIHQVIELAGDGKISELEIATLFLVNRLFSQSCRMQIFALKDLMLSGPRIADFDRALERGAATGSDSGSGSSLKQD